MSVGLVWALTSNTDSDPPVLARRGCHWHYLPVRTLCQCAAGAAPGHWQRKRPRTRPRYERRAGLVQARQPRRHAGAPALSKLPVHACFERACQKIRAESDSDRGPIPGGPGAMKGSMLRIQLEVAHPH
jgi:hypothetical protein